MPPEYFAKFDAEKAAAELERSVARRHYERTCRYVMIRTLLLLLTFLGAVLFFYSIGLFPAAVVVVAVFFTVVGVIVHARHRKFLLLVGYAAAFLAGWFG